MTFRSTRTDGDAASLPQEGQLQEVTEQVAQILKLTKSAALERIVTDYWHVPQLSLFGEAHAAREWIDDRQRNRKGQRMTLAFFFRWLKREQESMQQRYQANGATNGHTARAPADSGGSISTSGPLDEQDPYAAYVAKRAEEVQRQYSSEASGGTS